jgi:hypothetical protein
MQSIYAAPTGIATAWRSNYFVCGARRQSVSVLIFMALLWTLSILSIRLFTIGAFEITPNIFKKFFHYLIRFFKKKRGHC